MKHLAITTLTLCAVILMVPGCDGPAMITLSPEIAVPEAVIEETPDGNKYYLYRDIAFLDKDRDQKLDIYIPFDRSETGTFPAVLNIHGGGWVEGNKSRPIVKTCAQALVEEGYAVICNNYLLSTEEKKAWPVNIYDCKSALRYIRKVAKEYNIDSDRIGVMGNSAGGHLALLTGLSGDKALTDGGNNKGFSNEVTCIVNIYGVPEIRHDKWAVKMFVAEGMDAEQVLKAASPITYIDSQSPPVLSVHGDRDEVVPYSFTTDLDKAMKDAGVEHSIIKVVNGKHAFTLYPDWANDNKDLREGVIEFLDKHLK